MPDGPDVRALRYMSRHPLWRGPPSCHGCAFGHDLADGSHLLHCDLLHPGAGPTVDGRWPPCTGAHWRREAAEELDALVDDLASLAVLAAVAHDAREESLMYARGLREGAAAEREACCKAVCSYCAAGRPLHHDGDGYWFHLVGAGPRPVTEQCRAHAIRRMAAGDGRRP